MQSQSDKYHKSMAGEFFVTAQLQRLGINSSVTYGNAKRADVIAFSVDYSLSSLIEVKSTSKSKWPIGCPIPDPTEQPWVFVFLPSNAIEPPEFYILSQSQLHKLLKPIQDDYFKKYKEKHGEEYGKRPGTFHLTKELARPFKDKWETIIEKCTHKTNFTIE